MSPVKPCATCHHPKGKHRAHGCLHTWQAMGRTFMGRRLITKWCICPGYRQADA